MNRLTLTFDPCATIHISQLLAGFRLLERQGLCALSIRREETGSRFGHNQLVIARFPDGRAAVFDAHDSGAPHCSLEAFDAAMEELNVGWYFRRSHRAAYYAASAYAGRQLPLGFNYHVSCAGNPYNRFRARDLKGLRDPGKRHILLRKALACLPAGRLSDRQYYPERFEASAERRRSDTILFLTRTWFPLEEHDPACAPGSIGPAIERCPELAGVLRMDETRAALIRLLRKEYGGRAVAGFTHTPFARAMYPDLIVPEAMTRRPVYLRTMRDARICLTTVGLHRSTGWKLGEYLAASQAIVSEPLWYDVPGGFRAGTHYLPFETPEGALERTAFLLEEPGALAQMRAENQAYYEKYLRPDQLIFNALQRCV
ncbi:MAG: hypothetical protein FWH26_03945 [Oscillospiraceae bacterium]|nr:hypothetical protein [Oscillospiraceae bacterium]